MIKPVRSAKGNEIIITYFLYIFKIIANLKYTQIPHSSAQVGFQMIPTFLASGIVLYGIIQLIVALLAVYLAVKWNKNEFLPGLFFLFLYAFVEVIDLFFFTILEGIFIDVAQFGFILLAIIFFIVGMHPACARKYGTTENRSIQSRFILFC